jgi:hypothetical protein
MGDGTFVEAATPYGLDSLRDGRGLAVSDFDGNGSLDLVVTNSRAPAQYFVNHAATGHWLRVRLRGVESNRDAVGATVRMRVGERRQMRVVSAGDGYASQFSKTLHFGLGADAAVDELEVTWPSGRRDTFRNLLADRVLEIREGEGGLR